MSQTALIRLLETKTESENIQSGQKCAFTADLIVLTDKDAEFAFKRLGTDRLNINAVLLTRQQGTGLLAQAEKLGITILACVDPLTAILENSLVLPGELAIANFAGISALGGIGAIGLRCTVTDLVDALQGKPFETRVPNAIRAELSGSLPSNCDGLDVYLELRAKVFSAGVSLDLTGQGLAGTSLATRVRLASWAGIAGAAQVFCVPDKALVQELNASATRTFKTFEPAKDASYQATHELDLSRVRPRIITSDGQSSTATEASNNEPKAVVIGGSATCGRIELERIRDVFRNHRPTLPVTVIPDSENICASAQADDILDNLEAFGVTVSTDPIMPDAGTVITNVSGIGCFKVSLTTALQVAIHGRFGAADNSDKDARDSKLSGRLPKTSI
ncbi:MAG: aconitase family protein [Planctomycetota bacterium]